MDFCYTYIHYSIKYGVHQNNQVFCNVDKSKSQGQNEGGPDCLQALCKLSGSSY